MKKCLFVLPILFFISPIFAQKESKNSVNLGFTPSYLLVKDEVLSPMIYRGSVLSLNLHYQRIRPKGTWTVGGTYMFGKNLISKSLIPEFRNDSMSFALGEVFWEYMRHIKTTDKVDWKLGLNNTNTFIYRNLITNLPRTADLFGTTINLNNENRGIISTSVYNELKITTMLAYRLNNKFTLSNYLAFSLLSYSFSNAYNSINQSTISTILPFASRLMFFNQFFDLQNSFLATWNVSQRFNLSLGYHFRWLRQSPEITYRNFALAQQGFALRASFTW
ncbi:MAG: hypothetical protein EAZ08_12280 [Cytophagales bacterium]|nr:MAG: hypothetical protein EAZ08_12280 [Cytophagales bacterium]